MLEPNFYMATLILITKMILQVNLQSSVKIRSEPAMSLFSAYMLTHYLSTHIECIISKIYTNSDDMGAK